MSSRDSKLRRFPERGAVKAETARCAAASVCEHHKADGRCIANALPGREWCWTHQVVLDEGRDVKRYAGGVL